MAKTKRHPRPMGYWCNRENFERELREVIEELGHFPSSKELKTLERWDIIGASQAHHVNLATVRAAMGFEQERKPNGYWLAWDNFKRELQKVIEEIGHFPSRNELETLRRQGISDASRHHGGLHAIRARMGFGQITKPAGYWQRWENLERELREVIAELGHFPSVHELEALGRRGIINAWKYHGGLHAIRARMGFGQITKPAGYWQRWENLERELREVIAELGHFPFSGELTACGRQSIIDASRHHGGLHAVRARMGFAQVRKPKGYWKQRANFERELREIIEELGHFPSKGELMSLGRRGIFNALTYHGSISAIRQSMGFEVTRKPQGYWRKRENFERELRGVVEELGHFPSTIELRALGREDIIQGSMYHDVALRTAREKPAKPHGYWHEWENFERELRGVAEELGHFPSTSELIALGRQDIYSAYKHHDGNSVVRKRMGFPQVKRPNGYWRKWENLERELRGVIEKLGHFPSTSELIALARQDLYSASKRHGGVSAVRVRMGFPQQRMPNGYWRKWENFERELREIIERIGHFPSTNELDALGRKDIRSAFKHHGYIDAVRDRMGYEPSPQTQASKLRSLATIPGLTDDEFLAVVQTVPGMEGTSENVILKHRTHLNLGPLELPPATLDGGEVAFWEHCLEELQAKHPAPERLEELWVLERIAARLHRAASIGVLGREPVTAEDERRVVEFLEERARQKLDAATPE